MRATEAWNQEPVNLLKRLFRVQGMGVGTALKDIFVEWAKSKEADRFVIGVLKENHKARKVYESWGGKLSDHEQDFMIMGKGYPEVFYVFDL